MIILLSHLQPCSPTSCLTLWQPSRWRLTPRSDGIHLLVSDKSLFFRPSHRLNTLQNFSLPTFHRGVIYCSIVDNSQLHGNLIRSTSLPSRHQCSKRIQKYPLLIHTDQSILGSYIPRNDTFISTTIVCDQILLDFKHEKQALQSRRRLLTCLNRHPKTFSFL